jgi:hypothetical protein
VLKIQKVLQGRYGAGTGLDHAHYGALVRQRDDIAASVGHRVNLIALFKRRQCLANDAHQHPQAGANDSVLADSVEPHRNIADCRSV